MRLTPRLTHHMTPLAVDLDGTLVRTDLLIESAMVLVRRRPVGALLMPFWLAGGRAHLKHEIARRVDLDIAGLPYRWTLIEFLRQQRQQGRTLVLATASHRKYANQIADHLGLFHHVLATDHVTNLKAAAKARALRDLLGHSGFDYVGDSRADLAVWAECAGALLVEPTSGLLNRARRLTEVKKVFA